MEELGKRLALGVNNYVGGILLETCQILATPAALRVAPRAALISSSHHLANIKANLLTPHLALSRMGTSWACTLPCISRHGQEHVTTA